MRGGNHNYGVRGGGAGERPEAMAAKTNLAFHERLRRPHGAQNRGGDFGKEL